MIFNPTQLHIELKCTVESACGLLTHMHKHKGAAHKVYNNYLHGTSLSLCTQCTWGIRMDTLEVIAISVVMKTVNNV